MAVTLPEYKPQVQISRGGTGTKGSLATAGAEWGAIADFARVATSVSADYLQRKEDAKLSGAEASYKADLIKLQSGIDTEIADNSGRFHYSEMHEKFTEPAIDKFGSSMSDRYDSSAAKSLSVKWGVDSQKILAQSLATKERMENADLLEQNKQGYFMAKNEGDTEGEAKYLEQIRNISGDKMANNVKQLGEYNREQNLIMDMATAEEVHAYKVQSTNPKHRQALETFKLNTINKIAAKTTTKYLGTASQFQKNMAEHDVSEQTLDALVAAGGSQQLADNARASLEINSDSKRLITKGYKYIDSYKDPDSPMTMNDSLKKIMGLRLSLNTKSKMVAEVIEASDTIGTKSSVLNTNTGIYPVGALGGQMGKIQTTSGYSSTTEQEAFSELTEVYNTALVGITDKKEYAKIIDKLMDSRKELIKYTKDLDHPMTADDWKSKRPDIVGETTSLIIQRMNAPQLAPSVAISAGVPTISTDAEYEALDSGARYIHPDGTSRTKK